MATRFYQQATSQIAPVYDQQIKAAQSQIPSINKLYDALTSSLQQGSQTQLQQGVQGISEDASRRGVLRSTLPVDARTQLQGEISAALTSGLTDIGRQRLSDVSNIQDRIGTLRTNRLSSITGLADTLQQQDIREREFQRQLAADRASRAAANTQSSALNQILSYLQGGGEGSGMEMPDFSVLDNIFGTTAPSLRVSSNTQASRLQPAGTVNLQPNAGVSRLQPAAPRTRSRQPRLQGGGAISGSLRVR